MPRHPGCDSAHAPAPRRARIVQEALGLDFGPAEPEFEGPATTFKIERGACCESVAYDSSVTKGCYVCGFASASRWCTQSYYVLRIGKSTFFAHHPDVHDKPRVTAFDRRSRIDHCVILALHAASAWLTRGNSRFRRGQRTV